GAGSDHPPGGARQGEGGLRAGARLRHQARLGADEGAAPTDPPGDAAEADTGAVGGAAEEVPDHRRGHARARYAPSPPRRCGGHASSSTELSITSNRALPRRRELLLLPPRRLSSAPAYRGSARSS